MTAVYATLAVGGLLLALWAEITLPASISRVPQPILWPRCTAGPYRWLRHPMYLGNWCCVTGLAGLAAGCWNACAAGLLAELVFREWRLREDAS